MRKTKIVCTIGPATIKKEMLEALVRNGMNVARLNMSHGTHEEKAQTVVDIREIRKRLGMPVSVLMDIEGPKLRTGKLKTEYVALKKGSKLVLTTDDILGDENKISVSYEGLPSDVKAGDTILLNDGLINLKVISTTGKEIVTEVVNGGEITHNRGINVPGVDLKVPTLTEKDMKDIELIAKVKPDYVALSFVRKPEDVTHLREILKSKGFDDPKIISKIETKQALDNLEAILDVSDGAMVARGDLGAEIPSEDLPIAQKRIIKLCNDRAIPVITATQMLESMVENPRPTRAEITDIANAVLDGTDAVMLSEETTIGKYPLQAVQFMDKITQKAEKYLELSENTRASILQKNKNISDAIAYSSWHLSIELETSVIIASTFSGYTARHVSRFRPSAVVFAPTPKEETYHRMSLIWGVVPTLIDRVESTDEMIENSIRELLGMGLASPGENVIITAGIPWGFSGTTNLIQVHKI
ncbi:pyruvate kinase [Athalassotoga saccharophila]|uniref:pyruvate kinase n=1 Tax=Athalassotoga saccharophila TaxID=1441386 RepID=UPI00137A9E2F|nr:pyruvate kinase [Athalassotoga saccharophila]BBJ28928.1 pyruvate kinase [Athalassotoga saccharophila]